MLITAPPTTGTDTPERPAPHPSSASTPPTVTAVLVVRDGARWLPETLDALAESVLPPDRLAVVDLGSTDDPRNLVRAHRGLYESIGSVTVVACTQPVAFGEAVTQALTEIGSGQPDRPEWVWLLHDDTAPDADALARLVDAVRRSPSVGMAGPKVVEWDDPRRLVEAGAQITRSGRRLAIPALGEPDQGQYDARTDVLAVGTAGLLVSRAVFEQIGGFDPAFARYGGDLDLGWRAQLAGYRVIVVPSARIRDAGATYAGQRTDDPDPSSARRAARRAARRVSLTRCSPLVAPLLAAWMVVSALVCALTLLVLKRPAHAWDEVSDLGALLRPVSSVQARWRFRGKGRLRRRDLDTLFVTPGQAARHTVDQVQDALTPERRSRATRPEDLELAEPGPVAEEAERLTALPASLPRRIVTNPGFLAVSAATVVALVGFRDSLRDGVFDARGAGLAGGELAPVSTDSAGLWHAFRDSWHGAGFGTGAESGPHLAVLAVFTWLAERLPYVSDGRSPAAVTMTLLIVLGMPLATWTAYLAGRSVTSARWPRAVVALAWGTTTALAAAAGQGRVTAVLALVLLPLVAAGMARTGSAKGTYTSAFAAALGLGVLAALVPAFGVVGLLVALVLVVVGPGWPRRARAAVMLIVPVGLQGPWLLHLRDPLNLLAAPGLLESAGVAPAVPWTVSIGAPVEPTVLALAIVPVLVAGLLGLARAGSRGRSAALAALAAAAVVGLALALGAPRVVLGDALGNDGTLASASAWPGVGLALLLLALLSAVLVGATGLGGSLSGPGFGWRRVGAGLGVVVVVGAVLAGAGLVAWSNLDENIRVGQDRLPAVAVDQARGPMANRLLRLVRSGDRVDYELVGSEPGTFLRDLYRDDGATDPGLGLIVAGLAGDQPQTGPSAGERLADLAVGFVTVEAAGDDPLLRTLDATSGLTRLGTTGDETLWRVLARPSAVAQGEAVPPARVRIVTAEGAPIAAVATVGPHGAVDTDVAAGSAGRRVVFAEPQEWADRAQVSLDGIPLAPVPDQALPTYALPENAGRLSADIPPVHREWFLAQVALVAFVVFMAIPFGNRRSRRPA